MVQPNESEGPRKAYYGDAHQRLKDEQDEGVGLRPLVGIWDNPDPMSFEEWRRMDAPAQEDFLDSVGGEFQERLQKGQETYQSHIRGFQGEAWQHTWEEALDTVVDLFWLGRYVTHLELENGKLYDVVQKLREELRLFKEGPGA